jgi:hypothetical protein
MLGQTMAYRFPRLYAALAIPIPWIRIVAGALVLISMGIGVDLAANGLVRYPDWLDRLIFVIQAAVLSVVIFVGLIAAMAVYFGPTIFAWRKHKRLRRVISVLNFFLGWTIFGWLVLLAWGCTPDKEST